MLPNTQEAKDAFNEAVYYQARFRQHLHHRH